mgnify:CR=1 FL=1
MDLTQKTRLQGSWRNHLLAFLIPFCGMLLVMLVCGYHPFGTSAMLYSDNYHQYYPFFVAFRRALRSGSIRCAPSCIPSCTIPVLIENFITS